MQIFILIMVMALLTLGGQRGEAAETVLSGWWLAAAVLGPKLLLAALYAGLCRLAHRRLLRSWSVRWLTRLDRFTLLFRMAALGLWLLDLYLGLLTALRATVGDLILLDELIAMSLTLGLIVFGWWAYYPIDRHVREATLMRSLDSAGPVHAIWTRSQYLLGQLRHQMSLMLAPLLVLLAWLEAVERWAPPGATALRGGLTLGGAATVFLFAPVVIRRMWDTTALPAGDLRDMLVAMCRRHRVGVRELLLWRTYGGLVNAAVMGIVSPLRYILLTDALLERLPLRQVEAVMAHELAHVRRHHMFWLLIVVAGTSALLQVLGAFVTDLLLPAAPAQEPLTVSAGFIVDLLNDPRVVDGALLVLGAACWLVIFGWVSRRFERQADTFAVQHLVRKNAPLAAPTIPPTALTVDAQSVHTMIAALGHVAMFNHMPVARRSWRHGSIAWRQAYLDSIIGQSVDDLQIDRQVFWIKVAGAVVLAVTIAVTVLMSM